MLRVLVLVESQKLGRQLLKCLSDKYRLVFARSAEEAHALLAELKFDGIIADVCSEIFFRMLCDDQPAVPVVLVCSRRLPRGAAGLIRRAGNMFGVTKYLDADEFESDSAVLVRAVQSSLRR